MMGAGGEGRVGGGGVSGGCGFLLWWWGLLWWGGDDGDGKRSRLGTKNVPRFGTKSVPRFGTVLVPLYLNSDSRANILRWFGGPFWFQNWGRFWFQAWVCFASPCLDFSLSSAGDVRMAVV